MAEEKKIEIAEEQTLAEKNVSELQTAVQENLQQASPEVADRVQQAANDLIAGITELGESEREYGPAPETWEKFEENKSEIKENLQELGKAVAAEKGSIEQDLTDLKAEMRAIGESLQRTKTVLVKTVEHSCQKAVESMVKGKDFLHEQHDKLRARSPQEALEAEMDRLEKYIENAPDEIRPKLMVAQEFGKEFLKRMKEIQALENNPLAAQTEQQRSSLRNVAHEVNEKAQEVRRFIRDFPTQVRQAIKEKSLDLLHKACNKIASVLDKAINYIDAQKQKVLEFAPDTKFDRKASPEQLYKAHAQNTALFEPKLSGRDFDVKVAVSLCNAGYSDRKVKECMAHSPNLAKLPLKEKTEQIGKIVKDANKARDIAYSR